MVREPPAERRGHPVLLPWVYLHCALGYGPDAPSTRATSQAEEAKDAVDHWAQLTSGHHPRAAPAGRHRRAGPYPEAAAAALAMADLPPGQVRAELAPLWARLRAGTLPLSELPGQ